MYVLKHRYTARVHNLYMYDAISRDVLARWTYPYVPEIMYEDLTPSREGMFAILPPHYNCCFIFEL